MAPRIPNPKLTLPKLSAPKLGRSKAPAVEPDAAPATELEAPELAADTTAAQPPVAEKGRGRLSATKLSMPKLGSGPKLSMPKLSAPKLGTGKRAGASRGRPERDVVGLDIEPGYVVAVQATVNGSVRVSRAVGAPLGVDVVRDGEVLDPEALGHALAELFRGSGLGRSVRVGLANQRTVLRTLDLPPIEDRKELAAAVRFQAEEEVPMPLNNAVLDFQPLGLVDTPEGQRQRVVLVAAQRDMVERLLEALRIAGLRPVGVDLSAFALIRSLYERGGERGPNLVYLGVGGLTNMAVADGVTCKFTRVLGGGLESMAESLAARREITVNQARELLFSVGLPEEEADLSVPLVSPATAAEAEAAYAHEAETTHYDVPDAAYGDAHPAGDPYAEDQYGAEHDPYGAQPAEDVYAAESEHGAEHDPYGAQPAEAAYSAEDQYGAEHDPYGAQPAEAAYSAEDQYGAEHDPYGAQPAEAAYSAEDQYGAEHDPYGAQPAEAAYSAEDQYGAEHDPYGAQPAEAAYSAEEQQGAAHDPYAEGAYGAEEQQGAPHDPYSEGAYGAEEQQGAAHDPYAEDQYGAAHDPYAAAADPHAAAHDPYAADDDPYEEEEVRFHTYSDAEPTAEAVDAGGYEADAQAGEAAFHDESADGPQAADPGHAAPAEPAAYDASTRAPAYDDYEEPAPFTDDYVLETPSPAAAAPPPPPPPAPARAVSASYPVSPRRPSGDPDPDEDVHLVVSDGVREIAGEVRNSLDFQRIQGGGEQVQGIVLSGPVLDVPGFAQALERELGLPVYLGEVHANADAVTGPVTSSRLAVAAGLAVEEVAP